MPRKETNRVTLTGEITEPFVLSHETHGQKFYKTRMRAYRKSGVADEIDLLISENTTDVEKDYTGQRFQVHGVLKSHNYTEYGKRSTRLAVYVRSFTPAPKKENITDNVVNAIYLDGYICKNPIARKTLKGQSITDLLIAVNTSRFSSDYIPSICWNDVAESAGNYEVGDHVELTGRIQSRDYKVKGYDATRHILEVSITKIDNHGKDQKQEQEKK